MTVGLAVALRGGLIRTKVCLGIPTSTVEGTLVGDRGVVSGREFDSGCEGRAEVEGVVTEDIEVVEVIFIVDDCSLVCAVVIVGDVVSVVGCLVLGNVVV